jgi:hypothetical protein
MIRSKGDYFGIRQGDVDIVKDVKLNGNIRLEGRGGMFYDNDNFKIFSDKGEKKTMAKTTKKLRKSDFGVKDVIFNDPATIVFFTDGTKFVSKKGKDNVYDPEVGIALAVIHHQSGSKQKFKEFVKKIQK